MKKKRTIWLCSLLSLVFLAGCGTASKEKAITAKNAEASKVTKRSSSKKHSTLQGITEEMTTSESSEAEANVEMQRIGNETVGFVDVPSDWLPFQDLDDGDSCQYSDVDAHTVITMRSYTKEILGVEEINEATVEQAATNYAYVMEQSGNFEGLTGAKTTVVGYDTYQVYGTVKSDGKLLVAWFFKTEANDKVYFVSLEGEKSSDTFLQTTAFIEMTWSAKK